MEMKADLVTETDIKQRILNIGLTFPRELTLTITSLCNLRCRHCWPASGPDAVNFHISLEYLRHVIKQWHDAGLAQICITGGEPLVHPNWRETLAYCCSMPGITSVKLQSNGTLIDEETIEFLSSPKCQKVSLNISLDSSRPEEHDRIRGEGSFAKTLAALQLVQQAGLSDRTSISFTETAENFAQLPQTLRLIDNLDISKLTSNTLYNGGRAAKDCTLNMPEPQQYTELIQCYEQDSNFKKLYDRKGNISAIEWYKNRDLQSNTGTCSCMATPYINSNGTLYPCTLLPIPWLAIDNVWTRTLDEIIIEIEGKWAQLPNIITKRPRWIVECRYCSGRNHCLSGCMGRSVTLTGNFLKTEDRCLHRKAVYAWGKLY